MREAFRLVGLDGRYMEITSMADIPAGTGLGSSGSFTVALLRALHTLNKDFVPRSELAEQACELIGFEFCAVMLADERRESLQIAGWSGLTHGVPTGGTSPTTAAVAIAVIGLNIHFGYTGLLNIGQSAFMLLGAYGWRSVFIFGGLATAVSATAITATRTGERTAVNGVRRKDNGS